MNRRDLIILTAATIVMSLFESARAGELRVPGDFPTIQAAIDASVDGDEVLIADGVYTGDGNRDMDFGGRAIIVRSENGPEACIIDCEAAPRDLHRGFWFHSGESFTSVVRGISIINGFAPTLGGPSGGAIAIDGASPTITNCRFSQCFSSEHGGAVAVLSGGPLFQDCLFDQNFAPESNGSGGGGAVYSIGNPKFVDCTFTDNYAGAWGGGIFAPGGTLELIRCEFTRNKALREEGGGVFVHDAIITECTFIDNDTLGSRGGAILHREGDLVVRDSRFADRNFAAAGGAVFSQGRSSYILNCTFDDQLGAAYGGGYFASSSSGVHVLDNCRFWNGRSDFGGAGVAAWGQADVFITNSTFSRNYVVVGSYGAVFAFGGAHITLANCILWENTPEEAGGEDGGIVNISYSIVRGGWPGEGNIDADPLFVDAENGDLRLLPGSPAIDSGDNLGVALDVFDLDGDGDTAEPVPFDLDGYGRFVDDLDTEDTGRCDDPCELPIVDMGAYEFGMATGACCIAEIGDCTDEVPDEDCIDNGGRFAAGTLCAELEPPCVAPPCVRDPEWLCDGDVDGDGQVNPVDSGLVQAAFGSRNEQDLCNYDVDCDGQINPVDSGIVQSLFGTCAAPRDACP